MTESAQRLFELQGGPNDGKRVVVPQCEHHGWPTLLPTDPALDGAGRYLYEVEADRYTWVQQ